MSLRTLTAALLLGATPLAAQVRAAPAAPAPRFGVLAGLNSTTLAGTNFFVGDYGSTQDRRNGFAGGVYLTLPLGASDWAFRPEVLYYQAGARYRTTFHPPSAMDVINNVTARADLRLSYVQVPLLLQYSLPAGGGIHPQLYGGVAPAVRTSCKLAYRLRGAGTNPFDETRDCDDLGDIVLGDTPALRRFDAGCLVGGALALDAGGRALTVGARYTHGLRGIAEDASVANRAFTLYGSLEFPVLGR